MKWTIEIGPSKDLGYHIQARTADQLCSFAVLISEKNQTILRTKAADGNDVFTVMSDTGHATMNIYGKITYKGKWPK